MKGLRSIWWAGAQALPRVASTANSRTSLNASSRGAARFLSRSPQDPPRPDPPVSERVVAGRAGEPLKAEQEALAVGGGEAGAAKNGGAAAKAASGGGGSGEVASTDPGQIAASEGGEDAAVAPTETAAVAEKKEDLGMAEKMEKTANALEDWAASIDRASGASVASKAGEDPPVPERVVAGRAREPLKGEQEAPAVGVGEAGAAKNGDAAAKTASEGGGGGEVASTNPGHTAASEGGKDAAAATGTVAVAEKKEDSGISDTVDKFVNFLEDWAASMDKQSGASVAPKAGAASNGDAAAKEGSRRGDSGASTDPGRPASEAGKDAAAAPTAGKEEELGMVKKREIAMEDWAAENEGVAAKGASGQGGEASTDLGRTAAKEGGDAAVGATKGTAAVAEKDEDLGMVKRLEIYMEKLASKGGEKRGGKASTDLAGAEKTDDGGMAYRIANAMEAWADKRWPPEKPPAKEDAGGGRVAPTDPGRTAASDGGGTAAGGGGAAAGAVAKRTEDDEVDKFANAMEDWADKQSAAVPLPRMRKKIIIELVTSDRKLMASREGSKCRNCRT